MMILDWNKLWNKQKNIETTMQTIIPKLIFITSLVIYLEP
jgi:hypothetical protein